MWSRFFTSVLVGGLALLYFAQAQDPSTESAASMGTFISSMAALFKLCIELLGMSLLAVFFGLVPFFYIHSPTSTTVKIQSFLFLLGISVYTFYPGIYSAAWNSILETLHEQPIKSGIAVAGILGLLRYTQQKLRYARINAIKLKYGYTSNDVRAYDDMTVEVAQDIEANMAEWDFPRLFQWAWISDFIRTATDPGVSRALVRSGHMVNPDPMIEHERLQATIHLMSGFMAYKVKSADHSLVIARINEHHHRYGTMINSDDILYLIIHFAFVFELWINRFGYRPLEAFEIQANWVLWREIGVRMGVKYMPKTVAQAKGWRSKFEQECRWREDANEQAGMAMMNELIWAVPEKLKPFARKLAASILDQDIVHFLQLENLYPSPALRNFTYGIFHICAWFVRNFGLPRLSPYQRSPVGPSKKGDLWTFGHTPFDTLPFYQDPNFWNLYGYGALVRRLRGIPLPGPKFYGQGVPIAAMGAAQNSPATQAAVESKIRQQAEILEHAPYGYRSAVGYQEGRLLAPVDGPEYGSSVNAFTKSTPLIPSSAERFDKRFERRGPGFSKILDIEKPKDVAHFDVIEAYGSMGKGMTSIEDSA